MARATTAFATTTLIGDPTSSGTGALTLIASTTADQNDAGPVSVPTVFPPSTWFVVGMSGGLQASTFSPTGTCQTTFEVL
ncbi:MAG: hypothetical protein Q6360_13075 [Candidatus Brocadiales bacterium]|nr:hypothetical protein [Candidatus Brocadiales bacterium]